MKTIGASIQAHRLAAGLSARELAEKAGCASWTIYAWEGDRRVPHLLELWAVADVLCLSIDELIGRNQQCT